MSSEESNFELLEIKKSFCNAAEQIDRAREPTADLQFLVQALQHAQLTNRMKKSTEFRLFFWEDMGTGLCKRLYKESSHDKNYLTIVGELILQLVNMFAADVNARRFNQNWFSAITLLFDPQSNVFRFYKIPDQELQSMRTSKQEWRSEIKVGDKLDVYVKADERSRLHGWMQGNVARVIANSLYVEFPDSLKSYDTQIDRWSTDIMPLGTYTKTHYDWIENTLLKTNMLECDMHDKCKWYRCTILDIQEKNDFGRTILMANCALRVYRDNPKYMSNRDALGTYEGFGERWDELVPVYSPRLAPWSTKVDAKETEEEVTDDCYDDLMVPTEEFKQIFGVPRPNICTSALYLRLINSFGNQGGFEDLIALLSEPESAKKYEGVSVQVMGALAQCLTLPCPIFHKQFIMAKGKQIADVIKQRLLNESDAAMRDVKKDQVDAIIKSVDNINRRFMTKEERDKQSEIFRLEICSKSLKSQYLDRRIQGIKDLTTLIKNNTLLSKSTTFSTDFLIEWMVQNDTLIQIWDSRHTHLQLVQRSADIFKLLLKEGKMDTALLNMFWSLTASEYQSEVVKIIQESSIYLQQPQIEFFFGKVMKTPADKLSLPEFDLLCDLGKSCKQADFQDGIQNFFWQIVKNSDDYRNDLVEKATKKYADLVKNWTIERKYDIIKTVIFTQIQSSTATLIPTLNLLTQIIMDHNTSGTAGYAQTVGTYPPRPTAEGPMTAAGEPMHFSYVNGKMTVSTTQNQDIEESIYNVIEGETVKTLSLREMLNQLDAQGLVKSLLASLEAYCKLVRQSDQSKIQPDAKKIFVASKHFSHREEVSQRLEFLKFFAKQCDFHFTQDELRVIYDSLSTYSPVAADGAEFLKWCTAACQESTSDCEILDLGEVGELFSDLLNSKVLDVQSLPEEGFEFMQNYFISVNEAAGYLRKSPKKTLYSYGIVKEDAAPALLEFKVLVNPRELKKLDLVWIVVLQAKHADVAARAVSFLISIYMSLSETIAENKAAIIDDLLKTCISRLANPNVQSVEILRIIEVIKCVIEDSERHGTGNINSFNAILKGDSIDRIIVKNATGRNLPSFVVRAYTSATVWEFVDKISRMCELAPQFVTVRLQNGQEIKVTDYGKTLKSLGLKNQQVVTVTQTNFEATKTPDTCVLIDPATKKLTEKAYNLFDSWYNKYSDETGVMTPESAVRFIKGATGDDVSSSDDRITKLFHAYDADKDGILQREEFITFYENASRDSKFTVCQNLLNNRVNTNDLTRFCEMYEELPFAEADMPRNSLSHNQESFGVLMSLLHRQDVSSQVWELIRSLATNQQIYRQVLAFETASSEVQIEQGSAFWKQFFESGSIYEQCYKHEIIQALMQDSEDLTNRVFWVGFYDKSHEYNQHVIPRVAYKPSNRENQLLKQDWSTIFLKHGGLEYIVECFLALASEETIPSDKFKLQQLSFMATMMREYIPVAIQASITESESKLASLMNSMRLLEKLDFMLIQERSLAMVSQLMQKTEFASDEKAIVVDCLHIWKSCVFFKPELWCNFLAQTDVERSVMAGLLYCGEENIRLSFKAVMSDVARNLRHEQAPYGFLLKLLSRHFSEISQYPCNQFFALFNELIDLHFARAVDSENAEPNLFDPERLLGSIVDKIRVDNTENKLQKASQAADEVTAQESSEERERLIVGLVQLTKKIIEHVDAAISEKLISDKDLVNEIFREFLFSSILNSEQSSNQADNMLEVIKSRGSRVSHSKASQGVNQAREVSYDLLIGLIRKSPTIMSNFIRDQLIPLLRLIKKPQKWDYQPSKQSSRTQKYVGLRNLGCICYMNSMMQQFFMIPAFRYNLLCVDDGIPELLEEHRGEQIDDSMLHQMQKLFASLELSQRSEYNPIGFTFSFKEFDGRPTNISEQKDAQEFLNVLFDRLENALKPTSRKYLLESIFQGKQCNQLVCPECGKVKNRIEDMLNLSLTVKDIKSVYESLKAQIKGEVISGYKCDGCNKEVDIKKRSLIAETPNVLIVHLQRILFNFDSLQNEKENQWFEFPYQLDLKPYSYHEVMKTEPKPSAHSEKDPDYVEPIEEDCFEYKLVGVTVHSGSANAGHYWSYINTARGQEEKPSSDPSWAETEKDPWMEFNDSTVRDYNFDKLKDECYGDKKETKATTLGGASWATDTKYGKSGYILFYERRVKKPIKIVIAAEDVGKYQDLQYDSKTQEHIKLIDYRQGVDNEKPSQIFQAVYEDNVKLAFENDVYSEEFFTFVKNILENVVQLGRTDSVVNHEMRVNSITAARRATFDILARCFNNQGMRELVSLMIQIFEQDDSLVLGFMQSLEEQDAFEPIFELMLEAEDLKARSESSRLFRYLICKLKMIELDKLLSEGDSTVSCRVIAALARQLKGRVSRNWRNMRPYLQMFENFALNSAEQVLASFDRANEEIEQSPNSEPHIRAGMGLLLRMNMLETFLDFILGQKSPFYDKSQNRQQMGNMYMQPEFDPLMRVVSEAVGNAQLLQKYPQSETVKLMMHSGLVLGQIFDTNVDKSDFPQMLSKMCYEDAEMSKKVSRIILKAFNEKDESKIKNQLKVLTEFVKISDSLKQNRLEWVFGIPQIKADSAYRSLKHTYGLQNVSIINDTACMYHTPLDAMSKQNKYACLLQKLQQSTQFNEEFCVVGLQHLMRMCMADETVCRYVFSMPPHNYQYARYTDWFRHFLEHQMAEMAKSHQYYSTYQQNRQRNTQKAFDLLSEFEKHLAKYTAEDEAKIHQLLGEQPEIGKSWMPLNPAVIRHCPPQLIIGEQTSSLKNEISVYEDDEVRVQLLEIECQYIYSNPTGVYNLSLPHKEFRDANFKRISYAESTNEPSETRTMLQHGEKGFVLLQVLVKGKLGNQQKITVQLEPTEVSDQGVNMRLPVSSIKDTLFGYDMKAIAHFVKIDPLRDWGCQFNLKVTSQNDKQMPTTTTIAMSAVSETVELSGSAYLPQESQELFCKSAACRHLNYEGMDYCEKCGNPLGSGQFDDWGGDAIDDLYTA